MAGEGKKLAQCLNAASAYGKEIDALCETLNDLLTKELEKGGLPCTLAGNFRYNERKDESGWIYTDIAYSLPLMGTNLRKNRCEMYLGYQISLTGDGMSFAGNDEPLLHVCLWDIDFNFDDSSYMGYPLDQSSPYCLKDNRLIVWTRPADDWKKDAWTFSIRLLTLDSSQALRDRVIEPAIKLLRGDSVISALSDSLLGLVIYTDESFLRPTVPEVEG